MTFFDKTQGKSRLIEMEDIRIIILKTYFPI